MDIDSSVLEEFLGEFIENFLEEKINLHLQNGYSLKNQLLEVDFEELEKFDPALADLLVSEPEFFIDTLEKKIASYNRFTSIKDHFYSPKIKLTKAPKLKNLNEVFTSKIGTLAKFSCMVISKSEIRKYAKIIRYRCNLCDTSFQEKRHYTTKGYKKKCEICKKFALEEDKEYSLQNLTNIVYMQVQETIESSKSLNPQKILLVVEGEMVDTVLSNVDYGNNITVTGIVHLEESREKFLRDKGITKTFILVNNIESIKKDFEEISISETEEKEIKKFSKNPLLSELLINTIALDINGHDMIKRALLLQLFGGTKNKLRKNGEEFRSQIHILLMGDPGQAKSQFLRSIHSIAPKSIYADGSNSSGVGLTASVSEKNEFGERLCRAGALSLASGGFVMLDEMDKLTKENKEHLNQALEHGEVSINKASFSITISTKTSVLAAANPKHSSFDRNKSLISQFDFVPTTLSRFDLIFPLLDDVDEQKDNKTGYHLLNIHTGKENHLDVLDLGFVKKYIAYARKNINPEIPEILFNKIVDYYTRIRLESKSREVAPITPRVLTTLIRLCEANAKMRLSNVVEEKDIEVAKMLFSFCLDSVARNEKGEIDFNLITVGESTEKIKEKEPFAMIKQVILNIQKEYDYADLGLIVKEMTSLGYLEGETKDLIYRGLRKGLIYEKDKDKYAVM